jgi:hypothetical protein
MSPFSTESDVEPAPGYPLADLAAADAGVVGRCVEDFDCATLWAG